MVFNGVGYNVKTMKPTIYEEELDNDYLHINNKYLNVSAIYRGSLVNILDDKSVDYETIYKREDSTVIKGIHLNGVNKNVYQWIDIDNLGKDAQVGDFAIVENKDGQSYIKITEIAKIRYPQKFKKKY